jgi:hypothetical protein
MTETTGGTEPFDEGTRTGFTTTEQQKALAVLGWRITKVGRGYERWEHRDGETWLHVHGDGRLTGVEDVRKLAAALAIFDPPTTPTGVLYEGEREGVRAIVDLTRINMRHNLPISSDTVQSLLGIIDRLTGEA